MDGQAYVGSVTNVSSDIVHITGNIIAYLTCGNTVSSFFDLTLKPGETAGGGTPALLNADGLGGHALNTDCQGVKKYPDPSNRPTYYYFDRIKTLGIDNLKVRIVAEATLTTSNFANNSAIDNKPISTDNSNSYSTSNSKISSTNEKQAQMQQFNNNVASSINHGSDENTSQNAADLGNAMRNLFTAITNHDKYSPSVTTDDLVETSKRRGTSEDLDYVGGHYELKNDYEQAEYYYSKAAQLGSEKAILDINSLYINGRVKDQVAIYWYNVGVDKAKNGNPLFLYEIAQYLGGNGSGYVSCEQRRTAIPYYLELIRIYQPQINELSNEDLIFSHYYKGLIEVGKIYTACGENNKSDIDACNDALTYINAASNFIEQFEYFSKYRSYYRKSIKHAISDANKKLTELKR